MKLKRRIYGWKWKRSETGERVTCAPKFVCLIQHHIWSTAFRIVPANWINATGWRRSVWEGIVERFGWWGYSHRDESLRLEWERRKVQV